MSPKLLKETAKFIQMFLEDVFLGHEPHVTAEECSGAILVNIEARGATSVISLVIYRYWMETTERFHGVLDEASRAVKDAIPAGVLGRWEKPDTSFGTFVGVVLAAAFLLTCWLLQ